MIKHFDIMKFDKLFIWSIIKYHDILTYDKLFIQSIMSIFLLNIFI